ncbi:hypothetical protein [Halegenticoccus tardaugens]|uniref:hypothetical protein n=1 Tax=Halegenticoccus tardaugens TaxID=2071624 RepID=UPI00100A8802|nr:hypothetical protein [Halegenticoccus tardaugens]
MTNAGTYEWTADTDGWQQISLGSASDTFAPIYPERERITERTVYGGLSAWTRLAAMQYHVFR